MTQAVKTENHKRRAKIGAVVGAVALTCALGTMAYFTATDTAVNTFNVAGSNGQEALSVQVVEPNWDTTDMDGNGFADAAENILPGQYIAKDPYVLVEEGGVDAYVFLDVSVPTGPVGDAENEPLFSLEGLDINDDDNYDTYFTQIGDMAVDELGNAHYVYAWSQVVAPNSKTDSLFEQVRLSPYLTTEQAKALTNEVSVVVTAHAIQESGFDSAEDAWAAYQAQNQL